MTRKVEILNLKSTHALVLITSLVIIGLVGPHQLAASSSNNDDDRNILHDLGDAANEAGNGNEAGREAARNDYYGGQSHNDYCPRSGDMAWCTGYIAGYNAVWLSLKASEG